MVLLYYKQIKCKKVHKKNQFLLGNIKIDFKLKSVYKQDKEVHLFTKEKQILFYLVENSNQVLSVE